MIPFTIVTRETASGPVLELAGELDAATAPRTLLAVEALTPLPGQQVVVDLTGLSFCDSSGIATLIAAHNRARSADVGMALAGVPRQLARTLELTGLADHFVTHPTATQAEAAWHGRV